MRLFVILFLLVPFPAFAEFRVATPGTAVRGHFWLGEGVAAVHASDATYMANRLRLGGELHLGADYRFLLGCALIDELSSGETAALVGDVARTAVDFSAGYFLVPDRLWLQYSFVAGSVRGSDVYGYQHVYGHGPSVGWRFLDDENVNLALELGYEHIGAKSITVVDVFTQQNLTATYPSADVFSLSLQLGFDVGGRRAIPGLSSP